MKVYCHYTMPIFTHVFQKPAQPYPTNFSNLNYIKQMSQILRSKYRADQPFRMSFKETVKRKLKISFYFFKTQVTLF